MKLIDSISYQSLGVVTMLIGLGIFVLAFIGSILQLQILSGLIGLGLITMGLAQVKRARDRKSSQESIDTIMAKIDEIQQEIKKKEQSRGSGVVIADVLSSGLKYYSEYIGRQKTTEED